MGIPRSLLVSLAVLCLEEKRVKKKQEQFSEERKDLRSKSKVFPEGFREGTCGVTKERTPGRNSNPEGGINPVQAGLSLAL